MITKGIIAISNIAIEEIDKAIKEVEDDSRQLVLYLKEVRKYITQTAQNGDKDHIQARARCAAAAEAAKAIRESFEPSMKKPENVLEELAKSIAAPIMPPANKIHYGEVLHWEVEEETINGVKDTWIEGVDTIGRHVQTDVIRNWHLMENGSVYLETETATYTLMPPLSTLPSNLRGG